MKTDSLIEMLANGVTPVDRHILAKRLSVALVSGCIGTLLLMIVMIGGVRPDIGQVVFYPPFWAKLAFPICLGAAALWMVARVSRPGVRAGKTWIAVALPVLVAWVAAFFVLASTAPDDRVALILGTTWRVCSFNIAVLSVPAFIAIVIAIRGLASTQPRLATAAGGLIAGAAATIAYNLRCPEMGIPFWAVWNLLGMCIPTAIGALIGRWALRW